MFLKSLIISSGSKVIREINFRKGINLIVDETPITDNKTETGNNVGKTTVLKLIDFCLGADAKGVYNEPEYKKEYKLVKDFLKEQKVLITLILKEDLDIDNSDEIEIERNFLSRKEIIRRINGDDLTEDEFELRLTELIFPKHRALKPTFRQIISHNLRYEDESITHTLRTINKYSSDVEYETLHLFLLGCEVESGSVKQEILAKIKQEDTFKSRLEKKQTKTAYETALALINIDIQKLNKRKESLNLNDNFENDLNKFNELKKLFHNAAVLCIMIQICLVYFISALAKWLDADWLSGNAVGVIAQSSVFSLPILANSKGLSWLFLIANYVVLFYQSLFQTFN